MSKTVMRHFNLLLAVLLLASCNGVFGPLDTGAGARPPQGMGYARVSLDYHAPRTLIPSAPSFTRYELLFNCTSSVRPAVTADFGAGLPLGPVALAPGTWDIAVTACQNIIVKGLVTEFAAARGTGTVTISAGLIADPVSITLRPADIPPVPSPGLSGVFSYNITVDNGGGAGGELVLNAKNGELSIPVSLSSFPAAASIEVPAGEYDFSVVLTSSAGMKAGKYAAVHIYAGLETKTDEAADLDFYFTAADFASVIPLAGTLSIREPAGVLTGTKNVTISAYRDKDFSQFLASTGEYQWIDSGTEWFIEIPAPASAVYLRTELKTDDGNGETVYVHREQEPVAGIPVNGKSGIALALALYGIDTGVTVNGTVAAELAGQGRSAVLPGSAVTLKVTPAQRYHLNPSSLTVNGGLIPAVVLPDGDYCFTMPEADVTVNAEFLPDFVSITGKLSLHKPALLDLGAVNNTVISAYRDQGRFERIGLDAVVNWDGGVLDWTVTDIPAGIAIVYLRVEVTGSDNYIYRHDPAAISGIDPVTGKDAGTLTMTVYEISGFSSGGGMVSPDIVYASAGQTAVLAVNPSAGYHLKPGTLAVTRSGGQNVALAFSGGVYSFTMPEDNVTVDAVFLPDNVPLVGKLSITKPVTLNAASMTVTAYETAARIVPLGSASYAFNTGGWTVETELDWSVTIPAGHSSAYLVFELNSTFETAIAVSGIGETGKSGINGPLAIYSINGWNSGGGIVSPDIVYASAGQTAVLAVNPSAGYHLKPGTLAVTRSGGQNVALAFSGGVYSFIMPEDNVTVSAEFLASVSISGNLSITKPAGLAPALSDNVTVRAYSDPARTAVIPGAVFTETWADFGSAHTGAWTVSLPVNTPIAYLNIELHAGDGFGGAVYTCYYAVPVTGIGYADISGVDLSMTVYGIAVSPAIVNGSVTVYRAGVERQAAAAGDIIALEPDPASGYHLKPGTLAVTRSGGQNVALAFSGGVYSFTMPEDNVTVDAVFLPDNVPLAGKLSITKPAALNAASMTITAYETAARSLALGSASYAFNTGGWTVETELDWSVTIPAGHSSAYLVFELNSTFETAIAVSGIGETGKSGINGPLDIYSISGWNSGGGSITASRTEARPGDTVTLTVQAASGYEYRAWPLKFKVNGVILPLTADGQTYTFTMPASDAAVTVEPGAAPFQSVDPGLTLSTPVSTGGDTLALTEESPGTFVISGYNAGDVVFDMSTVPLAADLTVASAVSGGTETIVMSDYGFTVTLTPQSTPSTAVFTVTVTAQDGLQKTYTVRVE